MKKNCIYILVFISFAGMISCAYNIEEELYPIESCDTTNVTYATTIVPILQQNCYECHSGPAPISGILLEGHSNIIIKIDQGRLIGAIRHQVDFSPMPKDRPSLPECDILKIENWVLQGAPNN